MNYIILSIITLLMWGVWGVFEKITTRFYKWYEYYIFSTLIALLISFFLFIFFKKTITFKGEGFIYLLLATLTGGIGFVAFYLALMKGKASIIVPLTSLYPAVTVILAKYFLKEEINFYGILGILFAIIAIFLLTKGT